MKKSGVHPTYKMASVAHYVNQFSLTWDKKVLKVLQKVGEDFVDRARSKSTYRDRTGNLRSSIGFTVYKDGYKIFSDYQGTSIGQTKAKNATFQAMHFPTGFVLIGVAGMEYAQYVEAKHYDVISGSEPTIEEIQEYIDEIE